MSDIGQMMQDPSIRQMAEQFGLGGAGRGAGRGSTNESNNPDMYS